MDKLGLEANWVVRSAGQPQVFTKEEGNLSYGCVVLRNACWPGAVCVGSQSGFVNLYVGYGLRQCSQPFHPLTAPDICAEPEEITEHSEPNPAEPPDEVEPDSEDENKKEDQEA